MINDLLKEVCVKVYYKNIERDLRALIKPSFDLNAEFITNSLNRSREICRMILQDLHIEKSVPHNLPLQEIDLIVDQAFHEVRSILLQPG